MGKNIDSFANTTTRLTIKHSPGRNNALHWRVTYRALTKVF